METLHHIFLEEIARRIPQKTERVNVLADILFSEKETILRKLEGDTSFTFNEAMTISRLLNISLDALEIGRMPKPESLFKLNLIEYINPAKTDFALLNDIISILKRLKNIPEAKGGEITNILPQPLYVAHEHIFKFYLFKWKYRTKKSTIPVPYKEIVIGQKLQKSQKENVKWAKTLNTDYILDNLTFLYLVNDIKYYYHIGLITEKEVELIKEDLFKILDQINDWTEFGIFKETGKKINIYISNVNIDASYVYIDAPDYQLTIAKAFLLNGFASAEKITFEELKLWIQSIKLQSVLISGCNEKERIKYLEDQHAIIEGLSNS